MPLSILRKATQTEESYPFSQLQTNRKPLTLPYLFGFDTFVGGAHSVSINLQAKGRFQPHQGVVLPSSEASNSDCLHHRTQTNYSIAPVILPTTISQRIFSSCQLNTCTYKSLPNHFEAFNHQITQFEQLL